MSGNYNAFAEQLAADIAAYIEANIKTVLLVLLISSAVLLILGVIMIVANWRIYEKAGEHGWWSLVPVLGGHVAYKIAWHPFFFWFNAACLCGVEIFSYMQLDGEVNMPYIAIASLVLSIASLVMSIAYNIKLSKAFGHGVGFAVGLILLPILFIPILGFGSSEYEGKWGF